MQYKLVGLLTPPLIMRLCSEVPKSSIIIQFSQYLALERLLEAGNFLKCCCITSTHCLKSRCEEVFWKSARIVMVCWVIFSITGMIICTWRYHPHYFSVTYVWSESILVEGKNSSSLNDFYIWCFITEDVNTGTYSMSTQKQCFTFFEWMFIQKVCSIQSEFLTYA